LRTTGAGVRLAFVIERKAIRRLRREHPYAGGPARG
jgi:hypothetical protein